MNAPTLLVLGDICPPWGFSKDETPTPETVFCDALPLLRDAAVTLANLEAPATLATQTADKNSVCLKARPSDLALLQAAGVDALGVANNHILDFGTQGLCDTIQKASEIGLPLFGAGSLSDAAKPFFCTVGGKTVGVLAFAEQEFNCVTQSRIGANRWDDLDGVCAIAQAKAQCDYLVVLYHGGIEHHRYPSPLLQKRCRAMAAAGANLITCQHSHCIGTRERFADCEILYGQGNAVFGYRAGNDGWNRGLLLAVTVADTIQVRYLPVTATETGRCMLQKDDADALLAEMERASNALSDEAEIARLWNAFCQRQRDEYLPMLFGWGRVANKLNRLTHGRLVRLLTSRIARRNAMNLVRCASHREVVTTLLESEFSE